MVVLWKSTWKGKQQPSTIEDTVTVICRLSSAPCTLTCLAPFVFHVVDPLVGTKCIHVWSKLTINSLGML